MFNLNKLMTRMREGEKNSPQNSSNSKHISSGSPTAELDATEDKEEPTEGFLCPTCMNNFSSAEELFEHYECSHPADVDQLHMCPVCKSKFPTADQLQLHYVADHAPPASPIIVAASNDVDVQTLRQEVLELQTTLREERWYSEELKKEVSKLSENISRCDETEETILVKQQLKALEESRSLMSSELILLRNQLADAVDSNTSLKQQKEALAQKAAAMASERASLLAKIDEGQSLREQLENQLSEIQSKAKQEEGDFNSATKDILKPSAKETDNMNNSLAETEAIMKKTKKMNDELLAKVAALELELNSSKQSLKSNMLQKTSLETELFDTQNNLVDSEEQRGRLQQRIEDLSQQIIQLTKDKNKLVSEMQDSQNRLIRTEERYKQEMTSHEETQKTVELEMERFEQKVADVSSQLADALAARDLQAQESEQLKSIFESQIGTLSDNLSALRGEMTRERDKCERLDRQVDELNSDKLELEAKLENLLDERRALLERCLSSENECDKLRTLTVELRRKLDEALSALHELGRENQTLQLETAKHVNRKWANDSEVDSCTLCRKIFSVTIRKHHCRNCGNIFCNECSAHTATVPAHKKPVRVCDTCLNELSIK